LHLKVEEGSDDADQIHDHWRFWRSYDHQYIMWAERIFISN